MFKVGPRGFQVNSQPLYSPTIPYGTLGQWLSQRFLHCLGRDPEPTCYCEKQWFLPKPTPLNTDAHSSPNYDAALNNRHHAAPHEYPPQTTSYVTEFPRPQILKASQKPNVISNANRHLTRKPGFSTPLPLPLPFGWSASRATTQTQ